MAAVLCKSLGQCCNTVTTCITYPLRLCCDGIGDAITSPFLPYLIVTCTLNIPPALYSYMTVNPSGEGASSYSKCSNTKWLWVNGVFSLIHIIAALYVVFQIVRRPSSDIEEGGGGVAPGIESNYNSMDSDYGLNPRKMALKLFSTPTFGIPPTTRAETCSSPAPPAPSATAVVGPANSMQRLGRVLCYDAGVALYLIVALVWMVWQSVGIGKVVFSQDDDDDNIEICDDVNKWMVTSLLCGFLYMMLACVSFACSLICLR